MEMVEASGAVAGQPTAEEAEPHVPGFLSDFDRGHRLERAGHPSPAKS